MVEARRTFALVQVQAIETEKDALTKELASYEARGRLLTLRQDRAKILMDTAKKEFDFWNAKDTEWREREAKKASEEANEILQKALEQDEIWLRELAKKLSAETKAYEEQKNGTDGVLAKIRLTKVEADSATAKKKEVEENFQDVKTRTQRNKVNVAVGLLLRMHRRDLPNTRQIRANTRKRIEVIAEAEYESYDLGATRREMADIESLVLDFTGAKPDEAEPGRLVQWEEQSSLVRELLQRKRDTLDGLLDDYNVYINALVELQMTEGELAELTDKFSAYIDERVLWIRSVSSLRPSDFHEAPAALFWLCNPRQWTRAAQCLLDDALANVLLYAGLVLLFIVLLAVRFKMSPRLAEWGEAAQSRRCLSMRPTFETAAVTILLGALLPAFIWFLGWRLQNAFFAKDFEQALAPAIKRGALLVLIITLTRQLCRPNGLLETHFDYPSKTLLQLRRRVSLAYILETLFLILATVLEWTGDEDLQTGLGRPMFVAAMLVMIWLGRGLFKGKSSIVARLRASNDPDRAHWFEWLWRMAAWAVPLSLAGLACSGYLYTAVRLSWRLHGTLFFIAFLLVAREFLMRWVRLARRRVARDQAQRRREQMRAAASAESVSVSAEPEEADIDLDRLDSQTSGVVASVFNFALVIGLWLVWADVLPALGFLERVELWQVTSEVTQTVTDAEGVETATQHLEVVPITLARLLLTSLVLALTFMVVRNLPGLLEVSILRRLKLASGERYAITAILTYTISAAGIIFAFSMLGVGWGKIQWLVAAMSVGLGFGLQELFANFVSGIILLFERPIRVGDTVTVGGVHGTVTRIRIRATRILDWDRKELIVPNKEFIMGQLVNWTLSDSVIRMIIPVGIAYGSDTQKALEVFGRVVSEHPAVLKDPEPQVLFLGFGDSSLNFEIRVFCPHLDAFLKIKHELHLAIDAALREAGIEIPFPQRDLHVRSLPPAWQGKQDGTAPAPEG